jgi:hypothetical protein
MTTLTLQKFSGDHPFSIDELNITLDAIAGTINGLAGQQVIQFTPLGGNDNSAYVPASGGDFTGPITAPSMQIGDESAKYPVLTTDDAATTAIKGPVLKAAAVSALTQTISASPTQAEVTAIQTKLNDLIAKMKTAGSLA